MKILKYISGMLLAVMVLASCEDQITAERPGEQDKLTIKNEFGKNLVGRVTVDGQPRAGVVVSDGVNVIATDANGEYQMYTEGRQHVFISVPADCEVPTKRGEVAFYKVLDFSEESVIQRDFQLVSSPKKDEWTLLTLADVQIGSDADVKDLSEIVMPAILNATGDFMGSNVYGISLGDLVWNKPTLYSSYKAQVNLLGVPTFSVIGNHDHTETILGDEESDRDYRDAMGPTYYSANIGDCHLVVLDNILYSGVSGRNDYAQTITQAQLDWLKKDLEFVDRDKCLVIGIHAPTKRRVSSTHTTNNKELYEIVKDFKDVQILSGHTHNNFTTTIAENITETTFGAVMGAYWYPICNDGAPRGFAVLKFKGNTLVDKYYQGAGMERSYQMKLYAPKDAVLWQPDAKPGDAYDKILANIWGWHSDWTVEVQEDGGSWQTLDPKTDRTGTPAWDPSVHMEIGPDGTLDANHNGSKPENNNDHMFLYKPSAAWGSVTFRATDSFGNVYTSTINNKQ